MTVPARVKVSVLLSFSLVTILFFNCYGRYVVTGPELLRNTSFHSLLTGWKHSNQGIAITGSGVVELYSDNQAATVYLTQAIPGAQRYPLLRLACDIETRNVIRGREHWMAARVILLSHDQYGAPIYNLPHILANLRDTHDWEQHEGVFAVSPDTAAISISVQLAQATGTMWVRNLSLVPVTEKASYRTYHSVITLLWMAVIPWVTVPLIRSAIGNTNRIVIIAVGILIALGTLMPENLKEFIGKELFPSFVEAPIKLPDAAKFHFLPLLTVPDIYKAGHFTLFALLAFVTFIRRSYQVTRYQLVGYLILLALITEVLQLLIPGREARLGDILIDTGGIVAGLTVLRIKRIFSSHTPTGKTSSD